MPTLNNYFDSKLAQFQAGAANWLDLIDSFREWYTKQGYNTSKVNFHTAWDLYLTHLIKNG